MRMTGFSPNASKRWFAFLAEEYPSVAIVGAYALAGTRVAWDGLPYPSTVVRGRDMCRAQLLGELYVFGNPNSVLYRSDIVRSRHAFFNESNLHADTEACLEFLEHHDFGFVHQVLTFTRLREDSMRSYSRRVNTYLPATLYNRMNYGPKYLSEKELKSWIRECLRDYYCYLGEQVYKCRDQEFWSFHRGKLAESGYPLNKFPGLPPPQFLRLWIACSTQRGRWREWCVGFALAYQSPHVNQRPVSGSPLRKKRH
jgi:hypothetical protein